MVVGAGLKVLAHLRLRGDIGHLEHQNAVMGRERAPSLGNDVGMGDGVAVGSVDEGVDAVVDIFLNGVVDRALGIAGAGAVVIDAEASAAVDELDVEAHGVELHEKLRGLSQRRLDAAYLGDLAADVEVDELEAVLHAAPLEHLGGLEELAGVEAELAGVAAALFPFAGARGGELDADAYLGPHLERAGGLEDALQLVELLGHEEHLLAHLLRQQRQFDVALILVAVADDKAVGVHVGGQHCVELGLAAGLEADVVAFAVADDLLHDGAHLIDLNGVDNEMLGLEIVFAGGLLEAGGCLLDPVVDDVGETQEHGGRDIAPVELVHEFLEIDSHAVLARSDIDVSLLVDVIVIYAPAVDVIKLGRVFHTPFFHCRFLFSTEMILSLNMSTLSLVSRGDTSSMCFAFM